MIQLGQLYQEVAELVHQQEPAVTQINQGAEDTHRNVQEANTKLEGAIVSARNARRWKWYALIGISKWPRTPVIHSILDCQLTRLQSSSSRSWSALPSVSPRPTSRRNKPVALPCCTFLPTRVRPFLSRDLRNCDPTLSLSTCCRQPPHPLCPFAPFVPIPPSRMSFPPCVKAILDRLRFLHFLVFFFSFFFFFSAAAGSVYSRAASGICPDPTASDDCACVLLRRGGLGYHAGCIY